MPRKGIPIPSEIIMPFSGFLVTTGSLGSIGVILAGSLGNLVGSIATYFLGIKLGRAFLDQNILFLQKSCFVNMGREKIVFVGNLEE